MTTNAQIATVLLNHVGALENGGDAQASARKSFAEILNIRQALVEPTGDERRNRALNSMQSQALSAAINLARSPGTTRGQVGRFLDAYGELDWNA